MTGKRLMIAGLLSTIAAISFATGSPQKAVTPAAASETLLLGEMVEKLQVAIKSPPTEEAMETIVFYGTDSRYYTMVRGWLTQEQLGLASQLSVSQPEKLRVQLQARADFLTRAIRAVDLE